MCLLLTMCLKLRCQRPPRFQETIVHPDGTQVGVVVPRADPVPPQALAPLPEIVVIRRKKPQVEKPE